eukprot:90784-Prymnesium_polylepis.1
MPEASRGARGRRGREREREGRPHLRIGDGCDRWTPGQRRTPWVTVYSYRVDRVNDRTAGRSASHTVCKQVSLVVKGADAWDTPQTDRPRRFPAWGLV